MEVLIAGRSIGTTNSTCTDVLVDVCIIINDNY